MIRIKSEIQSSNVKSSPKPKTQKSERAGKEGIVEYEISPKTAILVEKGQDIKKGQQL